MPNPAKFKNTAAFMKACVPMVVREGRTQEQAVGKCMGMWDYYKRKNKKRLGRKK